MVHVQEDLPQQHILSEYKNVLTRIMFAKKGIGKNICADTSKTILRNREKENKEI